MARPLRIQFEGALYHIISRGNERMLFLEDADRIKYLNLSTPSNDSTGSVTPTVSWETIITS